MSAVRACLTLAVFLLTTSASFADGVSGTWLRDNGNAKVKFEPWVAETWLKPPRSDSKPRSGSVCSSTCGLLAPTPGLAKPPALTVGQSIQANCPLKGLSSAPPAAWSPWPDLQVGELDQGALTTGSWEKSWHLHRSAQQ
jgi:hypothetical protein